MFNEAAIAAWFRGYSNSWFGMNYAEQREAVRREKLNWSPVQPVPEPSWGSILPQDEPALYDAWALRLQWPDRVTAVLLSRVSDDAIRNEFQRRGLSRDP